MTSNDLFLEAFLGWIEKGLKASLTVSCRGTVISGTLVSTSEYFAYVGRQFITSSSEEAREIGQALLSVQAATGEPQDESDPSDVSTEPRYVHLVDASLPFSAHAKLGDGKTAWRCRLDTVDAWTFGAGD
jgi:hypothetical protein